MPPPGLDQHFGLGEAVEDFAVEQLIAKRPVEAFVVAVLPRRTGRDVERCDPDLPEPFLDRRRDKFAANIGPDIGWRPAGDEQLGKRGQDILSRPI